MPMVTCTLRYWWRREIVEVTIDAQDEDGIERKLAGLREHGLRIVGYEINKQRTLDVA